MASQDRECTCVEVDTEEPKFRMELQPTFGVIETYPLKFGRWANSRFWLRTQGFPVTIVIDPESVVSYIIYRDYEEGQSAGS